MGRTERCPSCGKPKALLATICPACGATDGLVLESAVVELDHGEAAEVDLGSARRRWPVVVLAGGLVVALAAGAVVSSRPDDQALVPDTPTTVAAPTTTTAVATTPASRRPDRDRYAVEHLAGPMLAESTGAVLYGMSEDAEVVRIDLDGGVVTRRRLRGPSGERADGFSVLARSGLAVLAAPGGQGALSVPDGPRTPTQWLSGAGARIVPAADPDQVWRIVARDDGSAVAERLGADGEPRLPRVEVPAGADVLGDDGHGLLLAGAPGGTYVLGAEGAIRVADGTPVAWSAMRLVVTSCDGALVCTWQVIDRADGSSRDVPATGDLRRGVAATLSPDGRWLAQLSGDTGGGLELVDLTDGSRRQVGASVVDAWGFGYASAGMWWAPDGHHLFWLDGDGLVNVWSNEAGTVVLDGAGAVPKLRSLSVAPAAPAAPAAAPVVG
jgi:hypothetical protein